MRTISNRRYDLYSFSICSLFGRAEPTETQTFTQMRLPMQIAFLLLRVSVLFAGKKMTNAIGDVHLPRAVFKKSYCILARSIC